MADNLTTQILDQATIPDASAIATDEIAGVHYQRIKLIQGADGVNAGDVSSANPLPIDIINALPVGANAIGKLAANSGVDIGDVDILSIALGTNKIGAVYQAFGDLDFGGLAGQVINSVSTATLSSAVDVQDLSRVIVGVEYSNATGTAPIRIYGYGYNDDPLVLPSRLVTPGNTGNQIATLETGYYNGEYIVIETNGVEEIKVRVEDVPSASAAVSVWAVGIR